MPHLENPLLALLGILLNLYWWVVILAVIMSWLTAFDVINVHNNFSRSLLRFLFAATEPVFRPIRKVIPTIAGFDLSPIIVLVGLSWLLWNVLPWIDRRIGF